MTDTIDTEHMRNIMDSHWNFNHQRDIITEQFEKLSADLNQYRVSVIERNNLLAGRWELRVWESAPTLLTIRDEAYPHLLELFPPGTIWGAHQVTFHDDIVLTAYDGGHRLHFGWECTPKEMHIFCTQHNMRVVLSDNCRDDLVENIGGWQCKIDDWSYVLNELQEAV